MIAIVNRKRMAVLARMKRMILTANMKLRMDVTVNGRIKNMMVLHVDMKLGELWL